MNESSIRGDAVHALEPKLVDLLPFDLQVEVAENVYRKDYTEEEKARIQKRLKEFFEGVIRRGPKSSRGMTTNGLKSALDDAQFAPSGRVVDLVGAFFREPGVRVMK